MTTPDFKSMFRHAEDVRSLAPGEVVFSEGDPGDVAYVVLDGEVEIVAGGRVVDTASAGSLVGEMALIDQDARSATARARTAARLAPIDQRRFLFLLRETPFFAIDVMRLMAHRLRHMNELR
jgi:CRP-like cAMP-binding protein